MFLIDSIKDLNKYNEHSQQNYRQRINLYTHQLNKTIVNKNTNHKSFQLIKESRQM